MKHNTYEASSEQWQAEVLATLVPHAESSLSQDQREPLRASCKISGKTTRSSLTISILEDVSGIRHTHGTIKLELSEVIDDVNLFDWTSIVVTDRDALRAHVLRLEKEAKDSQTTIDAMRKELDELIQAKQDHETQLLAKFAELLNQKKLRIRMQQRQLATQDAPLVSSKSKSKSAQKRKATKAQVVADPESDSEAFEPMDVDKQEDEDASDQQSVQANRSETGSATETEDEDALSKPAATSIDPRSMTPVTNGDDLHPVQSLPLGKPPDSNSQSEPERNGVGNSQELGPDDETASEDDEL